MSSEPSDVLHLARLASTGRLAVACAHELHRLFDLRGANAIGNATDVTRSLLTAAHRPIADATLVDLGDLIEEMRPLFAILAGPDAIVVIVREAAGARTVASAAAISKTDPGQPDRAVVRGTGGRAPPGDRSRHRGLAGRRDRGRYADRRRTLRAARGHRRSPRPRARPRRALPALAAALASIGLTLVSAIASACGGGLIAVPGADGRVDHHVLLPLP